MKRLLAIALVVAACGGSASSLTPSATPSIPAVTAAPTATPAPTAEKHALAGVLLVDGFEDIKSGSCRVSDGYDDVDVGANIVIKDGNGKVLGTTDLRMSAKHDQADFLTYTEGVGGFPCRFAFAMPVPRADFYTITIGRRDGPTTSYADLVADDWTWDLTLGS